MQEEEDQRKFIKGMVSISIRNPQTVFQHEIDDDDDAEENSMERSEDPNKNTLSPSDDDRGIFTHNNFYTYII